ncbi:hypothetical protein [Bacillus atrophaeus]|uniref:hypothetical protein n=1 Tax=Bacillus atrophaeus TaxID=1452 RepID=UPI00227DBDE7|nr:hypothetical protein [Bacillus atrophaeus]MCY8520861.1 hypothetical protein [Bacillus atrophaeus]MCY8527349.1 hypothetical protein [Bacillus atrophaeus]
MALRIRELERIDITYSYYISGILKDKSIDSVIKIMDEDDYFDDYVYLIGTPVELKIDRIEVEFLK